MSDTDTFLTHHELYLMRHALGLSAMYGGKCPRWAFRNYFVTNPGTPDYPVWQALVTRGFANAETYNYAPTSTRFSVTDAGIDAMGPGFAIRIPKSVRVKEAAR